jgi:hypothetical protein
VERALEALRFGVLARDVVLVLEGIFYNGI